MTLSAVEGQVPADARAAGLPAYALYSAMLAAAGLPIYIHAPKVYAETFGIGLGALGVALFFLRLIDLVQDPVLGWIAARLGPARPAAAAIATGLMAGAMIGLFAVTPPVAPLVWFAAMLFVLFTAYGFLSIAFYGLGVARAEGMGHGGHLRLAAWREGGALLGVCAAAIAPVLSGSLTGAPYAGFAVGFALLCLAAHLAFRVEWARDPVAVAPGGLRLVLGDAVARRLLLLALVNAAPLAVTSTLFLFFVESRLGAPGWEGPLLILFFLSAAASTPVWATLARRHSEKPMLLLSMILSILVFAFAAFLATGDTLAFAAVCIASGAMLGADLVILPALFARRLAQIAPEGAEGFGLWSFATKIALGFAAVSLLPLLEARGFVAGGDSPEAALTLLSILYALVPCAMKSLAVVLLLATPLPKD